MRAVIYARYSSDSQREESIEGQLRECLEFANKIGVDVVANYIDRAMTATSDNRPDFQRMIKDSYKHCFDMIIVWKLDRFARNRFDSAYYKHLLKKNGVRVLSARETIAEGSEGILLESVLEGYAEYFSADLSEKVLRGMTENALKCMNNGSGTPLGYYVDDEQHLQIDEKKAPYVREIFQRFADGEMIKTIIADMNARGVGITVRVKKSRGDKKPYERSLNYNIVRRILSNRKYIGEYKFKDTVVLNGVPAIIDQDIFDKVQKRLEQNRKAPAKHKADDDYLLTTKLFCGKCKAMMVGECGTSHTSKTYRYYKCVTQKRKHACDKKTVNKDTIENQVVKAVMNKIMDDELMEYLADSLYSLQLSEETRIPQLKEELVNTERGINNMLDAIQKGIILDSTKKRLSDLEERKKALEIELVQEQIRKPILTREQILFGITKFRNLDTSTQEGKRTLIESFVNAIYLYDTYALVTCNYKDGTIRISFEEIESSDLLSNGAPFSQGLPMHSLPFYFSASDLGLVRHMALRCIGHAFDLGEDRLPTGQNTLGGYALSKAYRQCLFLCNLCDCRVCVSSDSGRRISAVMPFNPLRRRHAERFEKLAVKRTQ